jgi:hypothetical protein
MLMIFIICVEEALRPVQPTCGGRMRAHTTEHNTTQQDNAQTALDLSWGAQRRPSISCTVWAAGGPSACACVPVGAVSRAMIARSRSMRDGASVAFGSMGVRPHVFYVRGLEGWLDLMAPLAPPRCEFPRAGSQSRHFRVHVFVWSRGGYLRGEGGTSPQVCANALAWKLRRRQPALRRWAARSTLA